MRPSILILAFTALVSADVIPRDNSTSIVSSPPSTTTWALTPAQICLQSCTSGDVNCEAQCVGSAHPNSVQVSETNECAAKCPQGNGTYSKSSNYASCLQACISSYYPTSQTAGAVGGSDTTVASIGASVTGIATGTGTVSSVATSSSATGSASTTPTPNVAAIGLGPLLGSAGGIAGLFVIFLAL
ncbi:hypothetical protein N431DRAFT_455735 [Stipitochalara longipes BDJ]|nr:hypothetical protein N431DRAFT_455735 [Stipitochalara longipes BDJ]